MADNLEKVSAQMRKGILEYIILKIISSGEVYSSDILKTLKENNLIVVEGTLYPLLSRLRKDGVITYYWVESLSGPPRKYFKLTKEGKELLHNMGAIWSILDNAVENISKK
ncbi:MAG: PadR family transcriptional regulator [Candidatus Gracilibacteria bacterium]|nr:PadR family transcriptional regulator [Candidatus Gracilibacteria bacterium]